MNRSQDISATMKPLATPAARSLPTWLSFCSLLHIGILGLQKTKLFEDQRTFEIHVLFTTLLFHFFPLITFDINARGFPRLKNIKKTHAHSEFWCILCETTFASSLRPSPQKPEGVDDMFHSLQKVGMFWAFAHYHQAACKLPMHRVSGNHKQRWPTG